MAYNPAFKKASYIKKYLVQTGDIEKNLKGKTRYQTRINSYRALTMIGSEQTVTGLVPSNQKQDIGISLQPSPKTSSLFDAIDLWNSHKKR